MKTTTLTAWSMAIAVSAFACSNNDSRTTTAGADANCTGQPPAAGAGTPGTSGTPGTAAANARDVREAPVTLTGCLQKGDGRSDYILTQVNTMWTTVGTSWQRRRTRNRHVGQEQLRAAEHAFQLDGDRDVLEPLVGKQVRVSGRLAKASDLTTRDQNGAPKDRDRTKIDEEDLAKVEVAAVDSVSDNCGGHTKAKAPRKPGGKTGRK